MVIIRTDIAVIIEVATDSIKEKINRILFLKRVARRVKSTEMIAATVTIV